MWWDAHIPGNILGLNVFKGCTFEGEEITSTTLNGLNAMQMTTFAATEAPKCSWDATTQSATFTASVPFTLEDTQALDVEVELKYKGTFCSQPGLDFEFAKVVSSIGGLAGDGTIEITGYMNLTTICMGTTRVESVNLTYSSVKATASVPFLGISKDLSSQAAEKLNEKLPTAAADIQQRLNDAAAEKMPYCRPINQS